VNSSDNHNKNVQDQPQTEDQWLNQLTGGNGGDDMTRALRSAILESHQCELDEQEAVNETQLVKLIQRCRYEEFIDAKSETKKPWWSMGWIPAFVTVATVALLLVVVIKPADYADTTSDIVYRGKGDDKQAIHKVVAEPMKQAIALQQALQQADAKQILLYQTDDLWIISVQFTRPISDEIRVVLKSYQLNLDMNKKLKVVFVPKAKE